MEAVILGIDFISLSDQRAEFWPLNCEVVLTYSDGTSNKYQFISSPYLQKSVEFVILEHPANDKTIRNLELMNCRSASSHLALTITPKSLNYQANNMHILSVEAGADSMRSLVSVNSVHSWNSITMIRQLQHLHTNSNSYPTEFGANDTMTLAWAFIAVILAFAHFYSKRFSNCLTVQSVDNIGVSVCASSTTRYEYITEANSTTCDETPVFATSALLQDITDAERPSSLQGSGDHKHDQNTTQLVEECFSNNIILVSWPADFHGSTAIVAAANAATNTDVFTQFTDIDLDTDSDSDTPTTSSAQHHAGYIAIQDHTNQTVMISRSHSLTAQDCSDNFHAVPPVESLAVKSNTGSQFPNRMSSASSSTVEEQEENKQDTAELWESNLLHLSDMSIVCNDDNNGNHDHNSNNSDISEDDNCSTSSSELGLIDRVTAIREQWQDEETSILMSGLSGIPGIKETGLDLYPKLNADTDTSTESTRMQRTMHSVALHLTEQMGAVELDLQEQPEPTKHTAIYITEKPTSSIPTEYTNTIANHDDFVRSPNKSNCLNTSFGSNQGPYSEGAFRLITEPDAADVVDIPDDEQQWQNLFEKVFQEDNCTL